MATLRAKLLSFLTKLKMVLRTSLTSSTLLKITIFSNKFGTALSTSSAACLSKQKDLISFEVRSFLCFLHLVIHITVQFMVYKFVASIIGMALSPFKSTVWKMLKQTIKFLPFCHILQWSTRPFPTAFFPAG